MTADEIRAFDLLNSRITKLEMLVNYLQIGVHENHNFKLAIQRAVIKDAKCSDHQKSQLSSECVGVVNRL